MEAYPKIRKRRKGVFKMLNLMDMQEVAKELKISIHTARAWSYQKKWPIVKLGRRVLVERESIENFVRGNIIDARKAKEGHP